MILRTVTDLGTVLAFSLTIIKKIVPKSLTYSLTYLSKMG